jgi:DNA (cytosine-5)-methyltransferase 1
MKVISLFAGIEGFGLAAHKVGWEVVASVEWEQFPQLVIKKNFPNTEIHGDIKQFDGRKYRGTIDIICGGFPCQPYSLAGKRKGKNDDRHLWPEMLRVIREVQPTWVIGENVPGLINWSEGVVFEEVQSDLEAEGYEVQSFILPAAGVGAPHRRDRVWIVAYSEGHGNNRTPKRTGEKARGQDWHKIEQFIERGEIRTASYSDRYGRSRIENEKYSTERRQPSQCRIGQCNEDGAPSNTKGEQGKRMQPEQREFSEQGQREFRGINSAMGCGHATNPSNTRLQRSEEPGSTRSQRSESDKQPTGCICPDWQVFPTQSPVCNGDDGISADLVRYILRNGGDCYTEEEAEKEAKRIISKVRAEGIKAGGNAIVHQVALQIFKSINEFEKTL